MTQKFVIKLAIACTTLTAASWLAVTPSQASFGNAPWCLVRTGDDVYWDCQFRTSQECLNAIASGLRGFCNVNPSAGPSSPPGPSGRPAATRKPN